MSKANFNEILFESVHEAFETALGQIVSEPLALHMRRYLGISNDALPNHIISLLTPLDYSYGLAGDILGKTIVKRMYKKAGLPFYEVGSRPTLEYVQELRRKLVSLD